MTNIYCVLCTGRERCLSVNVCGFVIIRGVMALKETLFIDSVFDFEMDILMVLDV